MSEVDKRFSPSYWTKRFSQSAAVDKYIEISKIISEEAIKDIPSIINIPYGDKEREKYDIFGVDLPDDAPILIFIHGGYWQYKIVTKDISRYIIQPMYRNGIKTIIIGYTLAPEYTLREINKSVSQAINKCLDYAIEKGSKSIGIAGHSAGVQITLISTSLINNPKTSIIKGFFLLAGVYNVEEIIETSYNAALKLSQDEAKDLSPSLKILEILKNLNNQKYFICIGTDDCPGLINQSKQFYNSIKQNHQSELVILEGIDHYNITENLHKENFTIVELILKILLDNN